MYSAFTISRKFLKYWISASNGKGHGIHSPFVYEFIEKVLNDKKQYECYQPIETQRKNLLSNNESIEVEDFGAGSTVIKTKKRKINAIAGSSLKPKKYAQLLFRIAKFYQPKHIIELGTSLGITASYLSSACPNGKLSSFEGSKAIANIAKKNLKTTGCNNSEVYIGEFSKTLPEYLKTNNTVDFAFIDGNHKKEPTINYFNWILEHSNDYTIMVFDDIYWSKEMEEAWESIKKHESVTLSIDLFFIGLIFLRKEFKVKQHFIIRY
ncbi:MAG: class I SAM-dependent methyltransferase [Ferruginibacter sp.]|nr:class I SAM-dependent methyltransferase [Ferruginibacter sp.]